MKSGVRDRCTKVKCWIRSASQFGTRSRFQLSHRGRLLIWRAARDTSKAHVPETQLLKVHPPPESVAVQRGKFSLSEKQATRWKRCQEERLSWIRRILKSVCLQVYHLFQSTQFQLSELVFADSVWFTKSLMVLRLIIWQLSCSDLHWRKLVLTALVHQC